MGISKAVTLVLFGFLLIHDLAQAQTQEQLQLIDAVVDKFITGNKVVGYGLSIVRDGELLLSKGYGKANIAEDVNITDNTLFAVGSISKTFTSLLAIKVLSERFPLRGEAVLDTPIAELVKELNFTMSDRFRTQETNFRDLLAHRTCVSNDDMIILFQAVSHEELVYRKRYDQETCSFRTSFSYNNGMIALAGNLLGKITGKTYSQLMAEFFAELGMKSSRVLDAEGSHEDLPNMSRSYTFKGEELVQFDKTQLRKASVVGGGGAVASTAYDMAQFLKFIVNGGKVDGKVVVPEAVLNWMYTTSNAIPNANYKVNTGAYAYGVGILLAFLEGEPWFKHNGFFQPYESAFNIFPLANNTNIAVFTASNGPGGSGQLEGSLYQDDVHIIIKNILEGQITSMDEVKEAHQKLRSIPAISAPSLDIKSHPLYIDNLKKSLRPDTRQRNVVAHKRQAEELLGVYGSRQNGQLTITEDPDNVDNLQINYGVWGVGILTPHPLILNRYKIEFTTTLEYDILSFGTFLPTPNFMVDFGEDDVVELIMYEIWPLKYSFLFDKDSTIDTYPEIPWTSDSCAPEP